MLCYRIFLVAKKFMKKKGEGRVSKFAVERFLSQSADKVRRRSFILSIFSCIEKFYASEGFVTIIRRIFCLTVPKLFVEEAFCAVLQKYSGGEKVYGKEGGGGISKLSVEIFLSQSAETFRR